MRKCVNEMRNYVEKKAIMAWRCRLFQRSNTEPEFDVDTQEAVSYYAVRRVTRQFFGAGGIAQLGERLHGMQEVSGSIPLISTKSFLTMH
jgi:hypothetical protein